MDWETAGELLLLKGMPRGMNSVPEKSRLNIPGLTMAPSGHIKVPIIRS